MKLGNLKILILLLFALFFVKILPIFALDEIESVPLINDLKKNMKKYETWKI